MFKTARISVRLGPSRTCVVMTRQWPPCTKAQPKCMKPSRDDDHAHIYENERVKESYSVADVHLCSGPAGTVDVRCRGAPRDLVDST